MRDAGNGGSIVNLASVTALRQATGFTHYGASKAAVVSLTRSAAHELGPFGIRVNALAPGGIVTPGYHQAAAAFAGGAATPSAPTRPLGRLGTPDDVALAITFLASDLAGYFTGAIVPIDGGLTA